MSTNPTPSGQPYLLLFRNAGADTHAHLSEAQRAALAKKWNDWFESLAAQGKVEHANPLGLGGRVVSGPGGERVTDGPYAEGKEIIGGYFYLSVSGLDEATAIAQQCPGLALGLTVEVRQVLACSPVLGEVRGSNARR
jgi:hypothetical protein